MHDPQTKMFALILFEFFIHFLEFSSHLALQTLFLLQKVRDASVENFVYLRVECGIFLLFPKFN